MTKVQTMVVAVATVINLGCVTENGLKIVVKFCDTIKDLRLHFTLSKPP